MLLTALHKLQRDDLPFVQQPIPAGCRYGPRALRLLNMLRTMSNRTVLGLLVNYLAKRLALYSDGCPCRSLWQSLPAPWQLT